MTFPATFCYLFKHKQSPSPPIQQLLPLQTEMDSSLDNAGVENSEDFWQPSEPVLMTNITAPSHDRLLSHLDECAEAIASLSSTLAEVTSRCRRSFQYETGCLLPEFDHLCTTLGQLTQFEEKIAAKEGKDRVTEETQVQLMIREIKEAKMRQPTDEAEWSPPTLASLVQALPAEL